uniref:Serine/threonine-protein phosphatase 6 regulatory ankyrin repeat subunit C n=1 Tax=Cacopsylla melanoneura TaxID=428564 RepID=A0A8D8T0M1_9HEMI
MLGKGGKLIKQYAYDHTKDLHIAVNNKHIEMVKMLLDKGADINECDKNNDTPLLLSIGNKDTDMVKLLLNEGAKFNEYNTSQQTPLYFAVMSKNLNIVQLLLDKGATLCTNKKKKTSNLLHIAVENKDFGMVQMLLIKGFDVNAGNNTKDTPLHIAAKSGFVESLKTGQLLLNSSANVDVLNHIKSPNIAIESGNLEIVQLLLNKGANVNTCNNTKDTPLHMAAKSGVLEKRLIERNKEGKRIRTKRLRGFQKDGKKCIEKIDPLTRGL